MSAYDTYDQNDLEADIVYEDCYVWEESDSDYNGSNDHDDLERRIRDHASTEK